MLGPKALLLAGGESTFTIRISAFDLNGLTATFSGELTYGDTTSVSGSTSSPIEMVFDLVDREPISLSSVKTSYQLYQIYIHTPYQIVRTYTKNSISLTEYLLSPGDVVEIGIETNSSS